MRPAVAILCRTGHAQPRPRPQGGPPHDCHGQPGECLRHGGAWCPSSLVGPAGRPVCLPGRPEWHWAPHSIDRFATADKPEPLVPPTHGPLLQFCSQFGFHPEAELTDSLSSSWAEENNWAFPPSHLVGAAASQLRASGAEGPLICSSAPSAPWWHLVRSGTGWAHDVAGVVALGHAADALSDSAGHPELSCRDGNSRQVWPQDLREF